MATLLFIVIGYAVINSLTRPVFGLPSSDFGLFVYLCVKTKLMTNYILFISGGEVVLVMLLALLFFGSKAIPDIAKTMGKGLREFKKATNEIKREINDYSSDIKKDIDDVSSSVNKETKDIKKGITDHLED